MKVAIKVFNEATQYLKREGQHHERATRSALASTGHYMQQAVKDAVLFDAPYLGWPDRNPNTGILNRRKRLKGRVKNYALKWRGPRGSKRRVRQYWGGRYAHDPSAGFAPGKRGMYGRRAMGRLVGAVRYRKSTDGMRVRVGFLRSINARATQLARQQAQGFTTRVTPRMRRMAFAMGFPLRKGTSVLRTPPRPWIGPVFRHERRALPRRFEQRYEKALARYRGDTSGMRQPVLFPM